MQWKGGNFEKFNSYGYEWWLGIFQSTLVGFGINGLLKCEIIFVIFHSKMSFEKNCCQSHYFDNYVNNTTNYS